MACRHEGQWRMFISGRVGGKMMMMMMMKIGLCPHNHTCGPGMKERWRSFISRWVVMTLMLHK